MATLFDPENRLAATPPMGWNSYNAFGGMHGLPVDANPALPGGVALEERVILEVADALVASGLRDAGYVYLNIDDRWQDPRQPRDNAGQLRHDPRRFPRGMEALVRDIHRRDLKFGIYAVANVFACGGEEGRGPGGLPATGSLGREMTDAAQFAKWGVDFVKVDWCGVEQAGTQGKAPAIFESWNQAIAASGRDMVLSASTWGHESEHLWGPASAHMWRTTEDLHASWESILLTAHVNSEPRWRAACGPTRGWNDPDMLQVGHPDLTEAESRSHFIIWAMMGAPLLAGHDPRHAPDWLTALLADQQILAIDQDQSPPARVVTEGGWDVWTRTLTDGAVATAIVNLASNPRTVPSRFLLKGAVVSQSGPVEGAVLEGHATRLTLT